ncbi:MAG: zf-TFIIB domain-containing protein [Gemmatimonadota bacterium]|nr:zf-TFIIB domain-containing protein [Gemmatimonadota bacterium]
MPIEEKPSRNEDEYFVKMDAELLKARRAKLDQERKDRDRAQHFMKCPKCGGDLNEIDLKNVKIDRCAECGGTWLDKGELEMFLQTSEEGGIRRVIGDLLGVRFR